MEPLMDTMEQFRPTSAEDAVRVDGLCAPRIEQYYHWMTISRLLPEEQASQYAYAVDYYVRDYVVDDLLENPLCHRPGRISTFGGSWYIQRTMEPTEAQLTTHLEGISLWYQFLHAEGCLKADDLAKALMEAEDIAYYHERMHAFLELAGAGYREWLQSLVPVWVRRGEV